MKEKRGKVSKMWETNLASAQAVGKHLILHFHCQCINDIVLILQHYMKKKKDNFGKYNSNFILKRHMKKNRDIIARERLSKSHLEKNLAKNQIESADNV
jgi:hypothetical protein